MVVITDRGSIIERALGSLGLFLLGLTVWAVERLQGRGPLAAVLARLVLRSVTAVGWVIDRLPLPDPCHRDRDGGTKKERHSLHVELDIVIARPIDDVFARLTDLSDYSRWMPRLGVFISSGQTSEDPVGAGTTYYDRGWMGTFLGEIAEFHAPTRVTFKEKLRWLGVTVMEARPQYELVSTHSGTEVHHTAEGELFGVFNVMKPAVAWMARGERGRTLRALKHSLESGRAHTAGNRRSPATD
jgi:uncharacterized protein YndB with AHSA1/START domain